MLFCECFSVNSDDTVCLDKSNNTEIVHVNHYLRQHILGTNTFFVDKKTNTVKYITPTKKKMRQNYHKK